MSKTKQKSKRDIREECCISDNVMHIRHNATTTHHWGGEERNSKNFFRSLFVAASEGRDWREFY